MKAPLIDLWMRQISDTPANGRYIARTEKRFTILSIACIVESIMELGWVNLKTPLVDVPV